MKWSETEQRITELQGMRKDAVGHGLSPNMPP
jgi:hypothetical protein